MLMPLQEREGRALKDTELTAWAAQQPLVYELVEGRLVLLAEHHQAPSRLTALRNVAEGVFGDFGQASAWMVTPIAELGGLSPSDLASDSEEGSQLVLRTLIRRHRAVLEQDHG